MTRYNLNIHHRDAKLIQDDQGKYKIVPSPVGHFYISLQEEGKEEIFFGKYPKGNLLLSLIGPGNILSANEKEAHEELTNKEKYIEQKHVYTKAVTVSKEEYDKGLTFAKGHVDGSIGSNFYFIGSSDCRHFIQDVWHAMGRPLYYTVVYTKAELQKLGTIAATDILKKYGSRDDIQNNSFITEGLSAVSLSVKLNVAIDKIEAIDALNLRASYMYQYFPQIIESLPFKVTIDSTLLNKALAGVEGVIENVTVISDSVQDQRLSTMNKLFNEFKIPNVTNYEVPYKGFDVNFDVNSYKDNKDYSTEYTLNIHHKSYANYSNSSVENNKMGKFFISFSEPNQKIQSFYGNDIDSNVINNNTIHTKSIILSLEEYGKAVKCAKGQAMNRVKDGNIYDIGDIDERNFIQDVWNAMGRPLYFTSAYSTHELQNLGTTSATDLLSMYGSFDILKHGKFIDKDLSKDMLANRLNIEVKKIEDIPTGLNQDPSPHLLKHFMINIDDEIMTKARIGVVPENCKPVIRYKSTNSTAVSENLVSFNYFQEIVISIMQKYKSMFENKIEFVNCANFSNGFKYEYNQRQPELFDARYELIVDSFHPVPNETHFVTYVLGPQLGRFTSSMRYRGEAMRIHMWYVSMFTHCFHNILGYNINVPKEEVANLVNNITARWNDKIDSLISNPTLNDLIKTLPASLNNTSNIEKLISDTLFNEMSTLGFNYYVESNVNNNKVGRYVECMNYMDNNAIEFVSRNSARTTKPVGYNLINWIKYNISQLKDFYARSMKQVEDWFKSNDMQEQFQIDSDILNYSSCEDNNLSKLIEYGVANNKFLGKGFKISQEPNKEQKTISNINGDAQGSMLLWSLLLFKKYGGAKYYIKQDVKNSVDSEYACRLAYSAYAPSVAQNEDIGLLGASCL